MESGEPLTKAKLFASHESGQWTEIGLGVVSIVMETVPAIGAEGGLHCSDRGVSAGGGGKRGKASDEQTGATKTQARLQMYSLDSSNDLLLSSYVSLDDIYTIQGDAILLWYDEAVGNEIACSFNSKEGCDAVYRQIRAFQQAERLRRVQDERLPSLADKFLVHPRNLATILDAAESQNKRFGVYVRDDSAYFIKLAQLFHSSQKTGETAVMELVARIVLALLQTPYSSDGKIIAQFVENECIDDCIDIVQYALGRRDKASGFVSFEERRATFHDPCGLSDAMKARIHVLYSCGFLKDLIPLSLEPADASAYSLLSTFTLRFTMSMLTELCDSPTILPTAFEEALEAVRVDGPHVDPFSIEPTKVAHVFELAAFVGEIAKTVKNAMIGVDMRTDIFAALVRAGLLTFLSGVLECALRYYDPPASYSAQRWVVQPPRAVQLVCDTVYSCFVYLPDCLKLLVAQVSTPSPQPAILPLLLRTMTVVRTSAEVQAVMDAVQCCGVGVPLTVAMFGDNGRVEALRHDVLRYWVEGNSIDSPPLLSLASHVVNALTEEGSSISGGSGVPRLSTVVERQVVYGLRLLTTVVTAVNATLCGSLRDVVTLSQLIPALAGALACPLRRLANLQSTIVALIAAVLERRDGRLVEVVASASASPAADAPNLLYSALRLYLQCSHRDNILTSSLAHLLSALCDGVHREKLQDSTTLSGGGSGGLLSPSPFVTLLRNEDSMSKTEQTAPVAAASVHPFEALASDVLTEFGEQLAVAAPVLHERLRRAVQETAEQAQLAEAETSSMASSMERTAMSGLGDFDAAAIDFGLEPPLRPSALEAVTEERLSSLTRSLTTSDEDDYLDDDEESEDYEEGGEEALHPTDEETADATVVADRHDEAAAAVAANTAATSTSPVPMQPSLTPPNGSAHAPLLSSPSGFVPDSVDPPSGRGSLLEDEENRLPRRLSVKRGRDDIDKLENEEEAEEAEVKRVRAEESAAA